MSRKRIGKPLVGIGMQASTRYKPEQEMRPRRKGENLYNKYLQCSKSESRFVFLHASELATGASPKASFLVYLARWAHDLGKRRH